MTNLSLMEIENAIENTDSSELVRSEDPLMRCIVASRGDYLDELVNDEDECVRMCVADRGFGHDLLANDESELVRMVVEQWNSESASLSRDSVESIRMAAMTEAMGSSSRYDGNGVTDAKGMSRPMRH